MLSTFDRTKLQSLLEDFYTLTHIRITVFDEKFQELASYPEHIAPFCQLIRTDVNGYKNCKKCDEEGCKKAAIQHSLFTYHCHAGLTESITPLYLGNIVIGYLLFGHVFAYSSHETGWNIIREKCKNYQIDLSRLRDACYLLPVHSKEYITSASHILETVASYLCIERMTSLSHQTLPVQIDEHILSHYTENIDAMMIAKKFNIGKTQLYEISKQNYGIGIAQYIRNLRIEKAKQLLHSSELSLAEIASQCGFRDYNYFIVVFKKMVGISPKAYQKQLISSSKAGIAI